MKSVLHLLILCLIIVLPSCKKDHSNPDENKPTPFSYDTDAQAFFTSSAISDSTQKMAVNDFVLALKKDSLWNKFKAIYPMLGGTATSARWNLKDPRDADDAYRLTFTGTPVFAATGVTFPTTSDYADTHITDSIAGGFNNSAISYFSRTQNNIVGYDMGCSDENYPYNELAILTDDSYTSEWFGSRSNIADTNTVGLFMLSATELNVKNYKNGVVLVSSANAPTDVYTNMSIWIGATRGASASGQKECALASIGSGLTDAQAAAFYKDVKAFQTKLNR